MVMVCGRSHGLSILEIWHGLCSLMPTIHIHLWAGNILCQRLTQNRNKDDNTILYAKIGVNTKDL